VSTPFVGATQVAVDLVGPETYNTATGPFDSVHSARMARPGLSAVVAAAAMALAVAPSGARSPASIDARLEVRIEPSMSSTRVEGRVRWTNHTGAPAPAVCLVFDGSAARRTAAREIADLQVTDADGRTLDTVRPTRGVVRVAFDAPVEPATATVLHVAWTEPAAPLGRAPDGSPWGVGGTGPGFVVPRSPGGSCEPLGAPERGQYRLVVDVPGGWRVAATGSDVGHQDRAAPGGARERSVWAVDAVDRVGWVAVEEGASVVVEGDFDPLEVPSDMVAAAAATLDRAPVELQLPPVHLRVIARPDLALRAGWLLDEVRAALAWFGLAYGGYPWPQLDLVLVEDGPGNATPIGPALVSVTVPDPTWLQDPTGRRELQRRAASVLAVETFRSVVAFDPSTPEWLVAGLERYAVTSYESRRRGGLSRRDAKLPGAWDRCRLTLAAHVAGGESGDGGDGELLTALVLRSLERHTGRDPVARQLRDVVDRGRLGTSTYGALRDALSAAAGEDLGLLLDEVVLARRPPDWTVRRVVSRDAPRGDGDYLTTIELDRSHTAGVSVAVRLGLADGTAERRRWDGGETSARWTVVTRSRVTSVVIDPDVEWPVEVRRADNAWQAAASGWLLRPRPRWLAPGLHLVGLLTWPWA